MPRPCSRPLSLWTAPTTAAVLVWCCLASVYVSPALCQDIGASNTPRLWGTPAQDAARCSAQRCCLFNPRGVVSPWVMDPVGWGVKPCTCARSARQIGRDASCPAKPQFCIGVQGGNTGAVAFGGAAGCTAAVQQRVSWCGVAGLSAGAACVVWCVYVCRGTQQALCASSDGAMKAPAVQVVFQLFWFL